MPEHPRPNHPLRLIWRAAAACLASNAALVILTLLLGGLRPNAVLAYVEQYGETAQARMVDVDRRLDRRIHIFVDCQIGWLPDGEAIYFTSTPPGGQHQVMRANVFTRQAALTLTSGGTHNEAPAISPDGARIAYAANHSHTNTIYLIAARAADHESSPQPVASVPMWVNRLLWSGDGARLIALGMQNNRTPVAYAINVEGQSSEPLPDARSANWSPDGRYTAYAAPAGEGADLFLRDLSTGETRRLTASESTERLPVWSPDGTRIAFISAEAGAAQLALIDLAQGTVSALTPPVYANIDLIEWSPDGTRIAFSGRSSQTANRYDRLTPYDIYVVAASGGEVQRVRRGFGTYINNYSRFCAFAWRP